MEVLVSADGSSSMEKGKESKSKALKNRLRELLKIEAYEACLRGGGGLSERNNQTRIFLDGANDFDETRLPAMTLLSGARSSSVWAGGGPEGGPRRARRRGR